MSDVGIAPIEKELTPDIYYQICKTAYNKVIEKYGSVVKNNREMIETAIHKDDLLLPEYEEVVKLYNYEKLPKFKKVIARMLRCFIAVDQNKNVLRWKKVHWPCKMKQCDRCAPYKANEHMRYPHDIVMLGQCDDYDKAVDTVNEINSVLKALDIDYIPVTVIPAHDGRNIISIACLRIDQLNELTEDNEVKQAVQVVFENWPGLEKVDRVDSTNRFESTYITRTHGIKITTTDLYTSMTEGGAKQEKGTRRGFEFDAELGQVVYMSKQDRQKKRDEDELIVLKFNNPSASNQVPSDKKEFAMRRAIRRTSYHKDRVCFQSESNDDVAYNVNRLSAIYIEELEGLGFPQPNVQTAVRLTQKEIDQYNELIAIPRAGDIPDNILEIEFTDLDRKTYGLKDLIEKMRVQTMASAQSKIRTNMTVDDFIDLFIKQVDSTPPD